MGQLLAKISARQVKVNLYVCDLVSVVDESKHKDVCRRTYYI